MPRDFGKLRVLALTAAAASCARDASESQRSGLGSGTPSCGVTSDDGNYCWPAFAPIFDLNDAGIPKVEHYYTSNVCGDTVFATDPTLGYAMLGRIPNANLVNGTNSPPCVAASRGPESLTWLTTDWGSPRTTVAYAGTILDTTAGVSVEDGAHSIMSAYDPSVVFYHGEYWVSFECVPHEATGYDAVSSCVGPLVPASDGTVTMDATRISIPILGVLGNSAQPTRGAAVPKLLVNQGTLYIYWDDVATIPNTLDFQSVDTRGTTLTVDKNGRLYPPTFGSGGVGQAIHTTDATATLVIANADTKQVVYDEMKKRVLAIGSLTSPNSACSNATSATPEACFCTSPANWTSTFNICYRAFFASLASSATSPLGPFSFIQSEQIFTTKGLSLDAGLGTYMPPGSTVDEPDGIPNLPATYNRFMYDPTASDTHTRLMGGGFFTNVVQDMGHGGTYTQTPYYFPWPSLFSTPPHPSTATGFAFPNSILSNTTGTYLTKELPVSFPGTPSGSGGPHGYGTIDEGTCAVVRGGGALCVENITGNLVVTDSTGKQVWNSGNEKAGIRFSPASTTPCSTTSNASTCHAAFQQDGNLVLYQGDSSGIDIYWATSTGNHTPSTYQISSIPPYVKITGPNSTPLYQR